MVIYGTALLCGCLFLGLLAGRLLGAALGIHADVGGVGLAMLLLVAGNDRLRRTSKLPQLTGEGVRFWSSIYLPVTVAMAASQNVRAAVMGGWIALAAGAGVVVGGFALVPWIRRIGDQEGGAK
ncbi:malonate transporter MadL subunit [Haloferula luteola]|uniref:Malonate transporter MadL subunit n=1 Tax=Haloferula luteola TaxID=595692 RepID=A0A840UZF2_9BACT|nr:malonate transporter subunit MadL [Haloferula luteola]MBB5350206.1 malonate transporter MadL subunit [Haloferula luteola]